MPDSAPPSSLISYAKSNIGPLLGTLLWLPSTLSAKLAARSGFQFAFIDMEHSPLSVEQTTDLTHAIIAASNGYCLPIIRVPSHGVEWIKWALDAGAAGLVIPMVNTKEEMESIINKAIYPPIGARSYGPLQAPFGQIDRNKGVAEYFQHARNGNIAILPVIESKAGVENAEAILGVEGVSGCFIGPQDLRLSLGLRSGWDGDETEFKNAWNHVYSTAKRLGKSVGTLVAGEEMIRSKKDLDFLLISIDCNALATGYKASLEQAIRALT